uniref:Proctolin n=1 Tax=Lygus hesperus TaxID=30085 RepID=A0A7U0K8Q3_LYGHE|nr:proctolin precursor [Lygus hesperus]
MYRKMLACLMVVCLVAVFAEARYLPTRSQDDRLVRLRQLLKDLLENDFDDIRPEHQMNGYDRRMFKRDVFDVPYMQH